MERIAVSVDTNLGTAVETRVMTTNEYTALKRRIRKLSATPVETNLSSGYSYGGSVLKHVSLTVHTKERWA